MHNICVPSRAVTDKGRTIRLRAHVGERAVRSRAESSLTAWPTDRNGRSQRSFAPSTYPVSLDAPAPRPVAGVRSTPALLREFVNHLSPTPEDLTDRLGIAREAVCQLQAHAEETLRRGRGLSRAT